MVGSSSSSRPGLAQQQLGQGQAHLPAARQVLGLGLEVGRGEPEAAQDGGHAQLDGVAVAHPEALLHGAVALEHRVVGLGRHVAVGQAVLEVVHFGLQVEQRPQRLAGLGEHGAAGVGQPVLRQVADGERASAG